jgi:hypothetical protein
LGQIGRVCLCFLDGLDLFGQSVRAVNRRHEPDYQIGADRLIGPGVPFREELAAVFFHQAVNRQLVNAKHFGQFEAQVRMDAAATLKSDYTIGSLGDVLVTDEACKLGEIVTLFEAGMAEVVCEFGFHWIAQFLCKFKSPPQRWHG